MRDKPPINGLAVGLAPLVVTVAMGVSLMVSRTAWPVHEYLFWLFITTVFSYTLSYFFGLPVLVVMHKFGQVNFANLFLGGAISGATAWAVLRVLNHGEALMFDHFWVVVASGLGIVVASTYWALSRITSHCSRPASPSAD